MFYTQSTSAVNQGERCYRSGTASCAGRILTVTAGPTGRSWGTQAAPGGRAPHPHTWRASPIQVGCVHNTHLICTWKGARHLNTWRESPIQVGCVHNTHLIFTWKGARHLNTGRESPIQVGCVHNTHLICTWKGARNLNT